MNLAEHYNSMRQTALQQIAHGEAEPDALLDATEDTRRGITLLTRPPAAITAAIETVLADFQQSEPDQYYYPATDVHVTILSIISCYSGFTLDLIDPGAYQTAVRAILRDTLPFAITYSGLTASAGGIMVQGFPQGEALERLRAALRGFFKGSGLQQSIDQRYSIQTAHSTVIRFRKKLRDTPALLDKMAKYQHLFIGTFEVNTIELAYHDWYLRAANTVLLERYQLAGL